MDIFASDFNPSAPRLRQLVDISLLDKIDLALTQTAEISFSIFDLDGTILSQSVHEHDRCHWLIVRSGEFFPRILREAVPRFKSGTVGFKRLDFGKCMSLMVIPIRLEKALLALIVGGPVWTARPRSEDLRQTAEALGLAPHLLEEGERIRVLSRGRLHAARSFLLSIAAITSQLCDERHRSIRNISMLSSLYNIETAMCSSLQLKDVLQTVLDNALELLEADSGSIMLLDEHREELRIFVARGLSDEIIRSTRAKVGQGIAGRVIEEGLPRRLLKGVKEAPSILAKRSEDMKSALSVPLKVKDNTIGVLNISGKRGRENFSDDEMKLLMILATHAAAAIDNAKLYESVRKKAAELSSLFRIGKAITSTLDTHGVLQQVLDSAVDLMQAKAGSLMLVSEETKDLYIEVAYGLSQEIISSTRVKLGDGISGRVALEGVPRLLPKGIRVVDSKLSKRVEEIDSALCVPLKVEERIIGVLNIRGRLSGDDFTEEDQALAIQLANQAAIAIENAKLHNNLKELFVESISALANAIDARDPYTRGHSERVTDYSVRIAQAMGFRQHEVDFVRYAALLHDIGKINIKDDILKKPGKLTDEEFAIMKLHPTFGVQIMEPVKAFRQMLPYMFHHHEQFGSGGYPSGIKGEDIPIGARILTVADAFDAMTSDRPYRPGMSVEAAVAELRRNAGKQFDPAVVEAFIGWLDKSGPIDIHRVDSLFHRPDGGT